MYGKCIIHAAYREKFPNKNSNNPFWLESLLRIYKTHPNTSKNIALALPNSLIKEKSINLAADLNLKEIQNFLHLQSEKQLGAPLTELAYDYNVSKSADKPHQTTLTIIIAPQKELDYYRNVLSQNALNLAVLDVDSLALERGKHWLQSNSHLLNFKNKSDEKLFSKHITDFVLCIGLVLNKKR
ncbi:MAG: pilus assembly protein PilM [Gammaproteobacteria bacterium]